MNMNIFFSPIKLLILDSFFLKEKKKTKRSQEK